MKKIYVVIILLILLLIIYFLNRKESYYNQIELSNNNLITNHTSYSYMDTVVSIGLDQLKVKNTYILIKPLNDNIKKNFKVYNNLDLKAFIVGTQNQFIIYVDNDLTRISCIAPLSHELIHLEQYNTKKLILLNQNKCVWKGDTLDVSLIPYNERAWEQEAYKNENHLADLIKKSIF